jgi:hypothetical protein
MATSGTGAVGVLVQIDTDHVGVFGSFLLRARVADGGSGVSSDLLHLLHALAVLVVIAVFVGFEFCDSLVALTTHFAVEVAAQFASALGLGV